MKTKLTTIAALCLLLASVSSCRHIRTAEDITPGNSYEKMDWRYGSKDIRIQTTKINQELMDRWFVKTGYQGELGKPSIMVTEIDNCTDRYIPTEMIRDIFEGVAIDDGRYSVIVGNAADEEELDHLMCKVVHDPKYSNQTCLKSGRAIAPHFLAKVRLTKAIQSDLFYDYEDYRMTITLYDIQTQEAIDSAWDVLSKRVRR